MSITRYIPCGSHAIIFGRKIFLACTQFSVSNKSWQKIIRFWYWKTTTEQQQQHIKLNKTLVVFLNGPFYIFEADNIIIIYYLLHWVYYQKKKKQNSKKDLLNVEELYLHLTEGVRWMNWLTQQEGKGVCKTRTADTCGWRMADADRKMRMEKWGKTPKKVKRIKRPRMAKIIK